MYKKSSKIPRLFTTYNKLFFISFLQNFKDSSMAITDEESKENKPITSTPLPNGEVSTSSGSDDDAPLRRPQDNDTLFNISAQTVVHNHVLER